MKTKLFPWCLALTLAGCTDRVAYTPAQWADVSGGTFQMGTPPDELCREAGDYKETLHAVTLSRGFAMSLTETTQGQFADVAGYNPSAYPECGPDCPVDGVSWYEAAAYCNGLSSRAGLDACYACSDDGRDVRCTVAPSYLGGLPDCPGYRLPTEAEWEAACRAGTQSAFYNGPASNCTGWDSAATEIGWYQANAGLRMHRAGEKKPNAGGLYDLAGGVWEWTHDYLLADLGSQPVSDPTGPATGFSHMLRGGSIEVSAQFLRCGSRYNNQPPEQQFRHLGFRCVRTVLPTR